MWSLMYKHRDLKRIILQDESSDIGKDRLSTGTSPYFSFLKLYFNAETKVL
jgi:hypothetical protein